MTQLDISQDKPSSSKCMFPRCTNAPYIGNACNLHQRDLANLQNIQPFLVSGEDLLNRPDVPTEWVWGPDPNGMGIWAKGDVVALGGYSGDGKTSLIMGLAAIWTLGGYFLGYPAADKLRTLLITESSERQIRKLMLQSGISPEQGKMLTVISSTFVTRSVIEYIAKIYQPDVVVFDTLSSIGPNLGVHNSREFSWTQPTDVTAVATFFRELVKSAGLKLCLYLCHTNKSADGEPSLKDFRGTGAVVEQADSAWLLTPSLNGRAGRLDRVKSRDMDETVKKVAFVYDLTSGSFLAAGEVSMRDDEIVEWLRENPEPITKTSLAEKVKGRKTNNMKRIDDLLKEGKLEKDSEGFIREKKNEN